MWPERNFPSGGTTGDVQGSAGVGSATAKGLEDEMEILEVLDAVEAVESVLSLLP